MVQSARLFMPAGVSGDRTMGIGGSGDRAIGRSGEGAVAHPPIPRSPYRPVALLPLGNRYQVCTHNGEVLFFKYRAVISQSLERRLASICERRANFVRQGLEPSHHTIRL